MNRGSIVLTPDQLAGIPPAFPRRTAPRPPPRRLPPPPAHTRGSLVPRRAPPPPPPPRRPTAGGEAEAGTSRLPPPAPPPRRPTVTEQEELPPPTDIPPDAYDAERKAVAEDAEAAAAIARGEKPRGKTKQVGILEMFKYSTRPDLAMAIAGVVFAVIHGCLFPLQTVFMGDMVSSFDPAAANMTGLPSSAQQAIRNTVGGLLDDTAEKVIAVGIGIGVASFLQTLLLELSAARQTKHLRNLYFRSIIRQELGWHEFHTASEASARVSQDMMTIQGALGPKLGAVLQYICSFIAGLVIAFVRSPALAGILLAVTPIFAIAVGVTGMFTGIFVAKASKVYSSAGAIVEEALSGIRTVFAFGGERQYHARFTTRLRPTVKLAIAKGQLLGVSFAVFIIGMYGMYAVAIYSGGWLVNRGSITAGDVCSCLMAVLFGAMMLGNMSAPLAAVVSGRGAAVHIFEVLRSPSFISSIPQPSLTSFADDRAQIAHRPSFRRRTCARLDRREHRNERHLVQLPDSRGHGSQRPVAFDPEWENGGSRWSEWMRQIKRRWSH